MQRLLDRARLLARMGPGDRGGQGRPVLQVLPPDQADGGPPRRGQARAPQAPPGHLARERELVQPFALVAAHARGDDARLPGRRGHLEARELLDHGGHAARPFEAMLG